MKTVIQTYKPLPQWRSSPPGIGDFIRGACHLHEALTPLSIAVKMDVSNTGFAELIDQDPDHFHSGPLEETSCSGEFFSNNNQELWDALNTFKSSDADHIYPTSNLGDWNRHSLPEACRIFGGAFFQFNKTVTNHSDPYTENGPFEVVHIRTGDIYMSRGDQPRPRAWACLWPAFWLPLSVRRRSPPWARHQ